MVGANIKHQAKGSSNEVIFSPFSWLCMLMRVMPRKPHPPAGQTFCLQGAASQKKNYSGSFQTDNFAQCEINKDCESCRVTLVDSKKRGFGKKGQLW